jgi:hypothetical protein
VLLIFCAKQQIKQIHYYHGYSSVEARFWLFLPLKRLRETPLLDDFAHPRSRPVPIIIGVPQLRGSSPLPT